MPMHLQPPITLRLVKQYIIRRLKRAIACGEDVESDAEDVTIVDGVGIRIAHAEGCYA